MDEEPRKQKNPGVEALRESERRGIRGEGRFENPNRVESLTSDTKKPSRAEKRVERNEDGAANLGEAEKSAEDLGRNGFYRKGKTNLDEAEDGESNPQGFYSAGKMSPIKAKGSFRRYGPFALIIIAITLFGGVMFGSQSMLPFSLYNVLMNNMNTMYFSQKGMSSYMMRWQLGNDTGGVDFGVKNPVKGSRFGADSFKITKTQADNLAKQGITYSDVEVDGKTVKGLSYVNELGETKVVTADNFRQVYDTDAKFHTDYNAGSQTWRGQFANWFGSTTMKFLNANSFTRNLLANFSKKVAAGEAEGKNASEVFYDLVHNKAESTAGSTRVRTSADEKEKDDSGNDTENTKVELDDEGNVKYALNDGSDDTIRKTNLDDSAKASSTIRGLAQKFSLGTTVGCQVLQFLGTTSAVITGIKMGIIISQALGSFLEPVSKTMGQEGNESGINIVGENLVKEYTDTNYKVNRAKISTSGGESGDGGLEKEEKKSSAMEAEAIAALYGERKMNYDDPGVQKFNITASMNSIFTGLTVSAVSFSACTVARIVTNVASATSQILKILSCVGGLVAGGVGAVGCAAMAADAVVGAIKAVGMVVLIGVLANAATTLAVNLFSSVGNLVGESWGNGTLVQGSQLLYRFAAQKSGTPVASKKGYTAYLMRQRELIADDARYERATRSPLDATSQYTFMGTLLRQVMSFTTNSQSAVSVMKTGGQVLSNSIAAISPTAAAETISDNLYTDGEYETICPYAASVGAICTGEGDQIHVTDVTTEGMHPADIINKINELDASNFEAGETSDNNVIVGSGSPLAKYIEYDTGRASQIGMVDYNIANSIGSVGATNSKVFNAVVGSTFIGDGLDILNSAKMLRHLDTIDGEENVIGSSKWERETKYYSRFCEQQTYAESIGLISESACSAYMSKVAANDEEESYLSMIAKFAGVDESVVAETVDFLYYRDYIANYDPSERFAFAGAEPVSEEIDVEIMESENILAGEMTPSMQIVYADVRNRAVLVG